LAKSVGSNIFDKVLCTYVPSRHPYEFINAEDFLLLVNNIPETTAQEFRAEFTKLSGLPYSYNAPRIIELDGFGEVQNASVSVAVSAIINGEFGSALSANITATNSPTSYTISSGTLPTGLSLNATTGRISGTPTAAGDGMVVGITASNAGGNGSANLTFNISKASQTISGLAASVTKTYGDAVFGLNAASSANLTVTYSSSNTAVATISGGNVTIVAPGNTTITASQAGNANYAASSSVATLTVNKKTLSLTGVAVASKIYDGSTSATINGTLSGVVGSDVITLTGTVRSQRGRALIVDIWAF
jgi:hypothetical protein